MESSDDSVEDDFNTSSESLLWANTLSVEPRDASDTEGSCLEHDLFYCLGRRKPRLSTLPYDMLTHTEDCNAMLPKSKRRREEMDTVLSSSSFLDEDCDFAVGFGDELFEELGVLRSTDCEGDRSCCVTSSDSIEANDVMGYGDDDLLAGTNSSDTASLLVPSCGTHVRMKRMKLVVRKIDPAYNSFVGSSLPEETKKDEEEVEEAEEEEKGDEEVEKDVEEVENAVEEVVEKDEQCIASPYGLNGSSGDVPKTENLVLSDKSLSSTQKQEEAMEEEEEEEKQLTNNEEEHSTEEGSDEQQDEVEEDQEDGVEKADKQEPTEVDRACEEYEIKREAIDEERTVETALWEMVSVGSSDDQLIGY